MGRCTTGEVLGRGDPGVSAMRDVLQVRTTPMGRLPHFPAIREPRYGPLRTRVGNYMEEFRFMLLRCLSEEAGLRLRELVAGGPHIGERAEPGAAAETVQAMRTGRNTRRVRRVSRVVPRGSRSRSRTPPSEQGTSREARGDVMTVSSSSSDAGASAAVADRGRGGGVDVPAVLPQPSALPPGDVALLPRSDEPTGSGQAEASLLTSGEVPQTVRGASSVEPGSGVNAEVLPAVLPVRPEGRVPLVPAEGCPLVPGGLSSTSAAASARDNR